MYVKTDDLEDKWRSDSPDNPPCASCDKIIDDDIPIRLWRHNRTEELILCHKCFKDRLKIS